MKTFDLFILHYRMFTPRMQGDEFNDTLRSYGIMELARLRASFGGCGSTLRSSENHGRVNDRRGGVRFGECLFPAAFA